MKPAVHHRTEYPGLDLNRITFEQAKGWRCPLCNKILTAYSAYSPPRPDSSPNPPNSGPAPAHASSPTANRR
jgi:hypothetical protein